jgi:hypothetical protein
MATASATAKDATAVKRFVIGPERVRGRGTIDGHGG